MAISERSRSAIYVGLATVIDEEAVQEMLSYFPARDLEEPVTRDFLHAEMADLRTEMRTEMAEFQTKVQDVMRQQTQWLLGVMITLSALIMAMVGFVGR